MSGGENKLISQEGKRVYGEEVAEETKGISQGNKKFDGADNEFKEACSEEIAFDSAHTEESAARESLQSSSNMSRYVTGTANDPKEDEEEENSEGNRKQPETKPKGGSRGWEK